MNNGNKLSYYDKATRELMERATAYNDIMVGEYTLPYAVVALREAFKHKLTYKKVFGEDMFVKYYPSKTDPAQDFCLISSYYIYSRSGGDKFWDLKTSGIHTWLQAKNYSEPFDITFTQFVEPQQYEIMTYDYFINNVFPYKKGRLLTMLRKDKIFLDDVIKSAAILGQCAGLE